MPVHALVPVISAAVMPPTAMPIEWPALPQTWAAKSAPIRRPRDHAAPIAAGGTGLAIERDTPETVPEGGRLVNEGSTMRGDGRRSRRAQEVGAPPMMAASGTTMAESASANAAGMRTGRPVAAVKAPVTSA